ncbi:hypothetical protein [uncultured Salinicola sp.]|uniref:hypothetical protein n=1 Tax=uncultured Salinicola sp. TaxID=1193542 RepID=UPI00260D7DA8|nr:hypothetical protein [uncultured Salinicola sp.]|tara:strand:- start:2054 stop:2734 length:681 start_codon:yes stop_codon:yes gene_type:complete
MELTDGKLIEQTKRRQILARAIHYAIDLRSDMLGASLSVSYDAKGNITFRMGVTETGIEDAELHVLGELLEMADAAGIPISQEIEGDFFHLVPFYQDFGFRLSLSQEHDDEISATAAARERLEDHVSGGGLASDLVFTMHRQAWSSALVSPAEVAEIRANGNAARTPFHERAQQRDVILIALQKRGLTSKEAGYRISPNMTAMEVGMRNHDRRKQGWNVPSFRKTS